MFDAPHPTWRRKAFVIASAAVAAAVVIAAHEVMLPFVLAAVIAYVLTPLVGIVERQRVPRGLAVVVVYAAVLGSTGLLLRGIAPRIALEFRNLRSALPTAAAEAQTRWVPAITDRMRAVGIAPQAPEVTAEPPEPAPTSALVVRPQGDAGAFGIDVGAGVEIVETKNGYSVEPAHEKRDAPFDANRIVADAVGRTFAYAQENSLEVARAVRDLVMTVSRGVFVFFITLMLAAYMIITRERILGFFRSLVRPDARSQFDALIERTDRGLAGVVRGQLVICAINGAMSAVGFAFIGLKYWPVMALLAAIFSLVPIFGSVASAIPAVGVALTQGFGTALFVLAWILGIHQLEANLLNPKIMGDSAKIHPVLIIFALLVGEHFFRAPGALLAVPTMSIAQSIFLHLRDHYAPVDEPGPAASFDSQPD
ncbi:MAG TPA: AI-2E family transporter [Polyangiaceae bacterium]|nr:AI-2E family transporter [Polyangiaceae bacterium]